MKNAATQLRLTTIALFAVLSFSAVAAGNEKAVASDKVQVQLTDGKSVVAEIDARTNADRLVLRFAGDASVLLRSIAWNRVVTVVPVKPSTTSTSARRTIRSASESRQPTFSELAVQALTE